MNIQPKTFRATTDLTVGRATFKTGDVVPSGPYLDRLIAYGFVAADESKSTPKTTKEGSDHAVG